MRILAVLIAGAMMAPPAPAHGEDDPAAKLFEAPQPGSYRLPPIDRVGEHQALDPSGRPSSVPGLAPGQLALLAYVYRDCADSQGCPLALAVLRHLDREIHAQPELAGRVRLIALSFDPVHDSPERMAELRDLMQPRGDWRFLTTPDPERLGPILLDYGQQVREGPPGRLHHVLKVFLLDDRRDVRNIYSAGLLDPDLMIADLHTLLMEDR